MTRDEFQQAILAGIPRELPPPPRYDPDVNHAPKRRDVLNEQEKKLAVRNALRYFHPVHHKVLATEFAAELKEYGRIYMHRFRPARVIKAGRSPIIRINLSRLQL